MSHLYEIGNDIGNEVGATFVATPSMTPQQASLVAQQSAPLAAAQDLQFLTNAVEQAIASPKTMYSLGDIDSIKRAIATDIDKIGAAVRPFWTDRRITPQVTLAALAIYMIVENHENRILAWSSTPRVVNGGAVMLSRPIETYYPRTVNAVRQVLSLAHGTQPQFTLMPY